MRTAALILLSLLFCSAGLVLSQPIPQREQLEQVILQVGGTLTTDDELMLPLKHRALDRALDEPSLVSLNIEGHSKTSSPDSARLVSSVRLQFAFPSVETYRKWRDSNLSKELVSQLKAALIGAEFQLSIQRSLASKGKQ